MVNNMKFNSIMHVSFFAKDLDAIFDFYTEKLGAKVKMLVKNKSYLDKPNSSFYTRAIENPEGICIVYFEITDGQFVEFFPAHNGQKPHQDWNDTVGYSHFSLLVDDIHKTKEELLSKGVNIDVEPTIGNSNTWQMWMHDPEGNMIEIMQYTDKSYQIVGHID